MVKLWIEGDSWGRGAWWNNPLTTEYRVYHDGFAQYARDDGLEVRLCAYGGSPLKIFFRNRENEIRNYDGIVIAFITEPLRGYNLNYINSYDELIAVQKTILLERLDYFNMLGKKIYLLGGTHKLDEKMIAPFDNLSILIPSITEFFYPDYKHPEVWPNKEIIDTLNQIPEEFLDELTHQYDLQYALMEEKYKEYFWPDGFHPNHKAHKVLYDYFVKNVLKKEIRDFL
ncbi:MAG: hypothetical protein ACO20H_13800 [Bacteriovoracaceae bacterium]